MVRASLAFVLDAMTGRRGAPTSSPPPALPRPALPSAAPVLVAEVELRLLPGVMVASIDYPEHATTLCQFFNITGEPATDVAFVTRRLSNEFVEIKIEVKGHNTPWAVIGGTTGERIRLYGGIIAEILSVSQFSTTILFSHYVSHNSIK